MYLFHHHELPDWQKWQGFLLGEAHASTGEMSPYIYGHLRLGYHLQAFSLAPHLTLCFARGISLQGLDILLHFLANTTSHVISSAGQSLSSLARGIFLQRFDISLHLLANTARWPLLGCISSSLLSCQSVAQSCYSYAGPLARTPLVYCYVGLLARSLLGFTTLAL